MLHDGTHAEDTDTPADDDNCPMYIDDDCDGDDHAPVESDNAASTDAATDLWELRVVWLEVGEQFSTGLAVARLQRVQSVQSLLFPSSP